MGQAKKRTAEEELAILQEILLLNKGQLQDFSPVPPPSAIKAFLRKAALPQLQGLLVELLAAMRDCKVPGKKGASTQTSGCHVHENERQSSQAEGKATSRPDLGKRERGVKHN